MVNQWGRDGNLGGGSAGGARSSGGFLIPALVALVIGAGGGYAGARYMSGTSGADLAARDKRIAELQQTLSELKFDNQDSSTQQGALKDRVGQLEDQLAAANRTKDSLRNDAAQQVARARQQAQAEIDALQKTLDEAGDLSGQLGRARKSLKVSELQIIELEKQVEDQTAEINRLNSSAGKGNADVQKLAKANADLEAKLADARKQLAAIPGLQDQIADLKEQLSNRASDADSAAKAQIAALQKERDGLQEKLNAALNDASEFQAKAKQLDELKQQFSDASESLSEREADVRKLNKDLQRLGSENADQKAKIDTLTKKTSDLAAQVASLSAELEKANSAEPADKPADTTDNPPADTSLSPRDRDAVEKAVEDLPGYGKLAQAKQDLLVDMLEHGECLTDSLKATYGHVPAVALRNLFRDLGGKC